MNIDKNYENVIQNIINEKITKIQLVSNTSNKVYKVEVSGGKTLYAKFYEKNSSHVDNELKLYDLVDNKYLKEIYYKSITPKVAIFKELIGKTIDELTYKELEENSIKIVDSVCKYFESVGKNKVNGYGILDNNLNGKYENFIDFLHSRQAETSKELCEYDFLKNISDVILERYESIIYADNSLVPIDTNLKNIMLLKNGDIKFVDPGEMISGPILMGYGDFVAHTYKTPLYYRLMEKLNLNANQEKLLRIYAIFSSLNILAFLKRNGVTKLDEVIPYGNKYTFFNLIKEHLKFLDIIV